MENVSLIPKPEDVVTSGESEEKIAKYMQNVILELFKRVSFNMILLGGYLYYFREKEYYQKFGYGGFGEWYQSMGLSRGTVYRALNIYEHIYQKFQLPEEDVSGDVKKLEMIVPLVKAGIVDENNINEWVEKAHVLPEGDFIKEISEVRGRKSARERLHDDGLEPGVYIITKAHGLSVDNLEMIEKVSVEVMKTDDGLFAVRI